MAWTNFIEYWKSNIKDNIKKISAIIGDMIITFIALMLYVFSEGFDFVSAFIIIAFSLKSYLTLYINIVFKGDSAIKDQAIMDLQTQLNYHQEIAGYQIQLAAVKGEVPKTVMNVYDWNEINKKIQELENKIAENEPI